MKKITSENPITFRADGDTVLEIDKDGVITHDAAAALAKERLGDNVTVEDADVESAVQDAQDSLSLNDLKARARELGLPVSGTKDELTERIDAKEKEDAAAALAAGENTNNVPGENTAGPV